MRARQRNTRILGGYLAAPTCEINTGWVGKLDDSWGNVFGLTHYPKDPVEARPTSQ
jgi:hypothetical protein